MTCKICKKSIQGNKHRKPQYKHIYCSLACKKRYKAYTSYKNKPSAYKLKGLSFEEYEVEVLRRKVRGKIPKNIRLKFKGKRKYVEPTTNKRLEQKKKVAKLFNKNNKEYYRMRSWVKRNSGINLTKAVILENWNILADYKNRLTLVKFRKIKENI